MKKISKLISVFVLAGTALMLAGCAKDYSPEMSELQKEIDDLSQKHATDASSLQGQIDGLKTDIATINANITTVKAALEAADKALDQKKLDKTTYDADKAALELKLSQLQNDLIAKTTELAQKIADARSEAKQGIADLSNAIDIKLASLDAAYKAGDLAVVSQLQGEIANLRTELINKIDKVETEYKNADAAIINNLDFFKTAINAKVDSLGVVSADVDKMLAARITSEVSALNVKIAAEVAKLEAAYKGADAELVKDYSAKITTLNEKLDQAVQQLNKAIINGDKALDDKYSAEVTAIKASITALETLHKTEMVKLEAAYKDADQTIKAELNSKISDLQSQLNTAVSNLNQAIKDGDTALDKKYAAEVTAIKASVTAIELKHAQEIAKLESDYKDADQSLKTELLDKISAEVKTLESAIASGDDKVAADAQSKINSLSSEIYDEIAKVRSEFAAADGALYSKITTEYMILIGDIQNSLETLTAKDVDLQAQITAACSRILAVEGLSATNQQKIQDAFKAIAKQKEYIDQQDKVLEALINTTADETLNSAKEFATAAVASAKETLEAAIKSGDKATLESAAKYTNKCIDVVNDVLDSLKMKEGIDVARLEKEISDVKASVSTLESKVNNAVTELKNAIANGDVKTLGEAQTYADGIVKNATIELQAYADNLFTKISIKEADDYTELKAYIADLNSSLATLKTKVDDNYKTLETAYKSGDEETLNKAKLYTDAQLNLAKAYSDNLFTMISVKEAADYAELKAALGTLKTTVDENYKALETAYKTGDENTLKMAKLYADAQLAAAKAYTDSQISDLRKEYKDADKEVIKKLREELAKKAIELTEAYKAADSVLCVKLEKEIAALDLKVNSLYNDIVLVQIPQAKAEAIAAAATYTDKQIDSLDKEVQKKIDELKGVDTKLWKALDSTQKAIHAQIAAEVKKLNERITAEVKTLNDRIDDIETEEGVQSKRITALETRCDIFDGYFTNLFAAVKANENAIDSLAKVTTAIISDVDALTTRVSVNEVDIDNNRKAIAANKKETDAKITALALRVESLEKWSAGVDATLTEFQTRIEKLETFTWKGILEKLDNLEARIKDLEENTIQSMSVLAPQKGKFEITEFTFDGNKVGTNVKFEAKFRVKPAAVAKELDTTNLKLYVMEGVTRAALDENKAYSVDSVAVVDAANGIVRVVAYVPKKASEDNVYYFALSSVNKKGVNYYMSEYTKAYFGTKELKLSFKWYSLSNKTFSKDSALFALGELDWFETYCNTGKQGKYTSPRKGGSDDIPVLYIGLDDAPKSPDYITLQELNECLGTTFKYYVDVLPATKYERITERAKTGKREPTKIEQLKSEDCAIIFQGLWGCDTVYSHQPYMFSKTPIVTTTYKDIRECIDQRVTRVVRVQISETGTKGSFVNTNLSSTFEYLTIKKHKWPDTQIDTTLGFLWSYLSPVDTKPEDKLLTLPEHLWGDNFENPGFLSQQLESADITTSSFVLDTVFHYDGIIGLATDTTKFNLKMNVQQFNKKCVKGFYNIYADNGHNTAVIRVNIYAVGAPIVKYNKTFTDPVQINFKDGTKIYDAFITNEAKYYTRNFGDVEVEVKYLELPDKLVTFKGMDYMNGGKEIPSTEIDGYYALLRNTLGDRMYFPTPCKQSYMEADPVVTAGSDTSFLFFDKTNLEYDKNYDLTVTKNELFKAGESKAKFIANYKFSTEVIPFKITSKQASFDVSGSYVDGTYQVDPQKVTDAFKVVWATGPKMGELYDGPVPMQVTLAAKYENNVEGAIQFTQSTGISVVAGVVDPSGLLTTQWSTYNGLKPGVQASLSYGPSYMFSAFGIDSVKYVHKIPFQKVEYKKFVDTTRVSGTFFTKKLDGNISFHDIIKTGMEQEPTDLTYEIQWTNLSQYGQVKSIWKDKANHKYNNTYFVIDWPNRKSTFNGAEYASPANQVYLSDDKGDLYINMSADLENGKYVFKVPVQFHYYLNYNDKDEKYRVKTFDKGVTDEGVLVIEIGK